MCLPHHWISWQNQINQDIIPEAFLQHTGIHQNANNVNRIYHIKGFSIILIIKDHLETLTTFRTHANEI